MINGGPEYATFIVKFVQEKIVKKSVTTIDNHELRSAGAFAYYI